MTTTTTTEKLITALEERGFKHWTKGDKDRMYIDAEKLGLKVQKYGSGAVKHAEWAGEKISNREGASMLHAKTYLDLTDMSVHSDDSDLLAAAEAIIEETRASLEEEEKKEEKEAAMSTTTAMQELYQGIKLRRPYGLLHKGDGPEDMPEHARKGSRKTRYRRPDDDEPRHGIGVSSLRLGV